MLPPRYVVSLVVVSVMVLGAGVASAQDYPSKPIRIVTSSPGGGQDFVARLIAQLLTGNLGQPVIVENRASALVPEIVSRAPPDGYTLLLNGNSHWLAPFMQNVPFDAVRDFLPITLAATSPNVVVVHPSLPVKSVKELIALAKARAGELNYGSSNVGAITHLAPELFKAMAGVNIVHISYKGAGAALNALIGGEVQLMFPNAPSVTPHMKSGRLRVLAVTSAQPSVLVPDLPTVAASGLPGYEATTMTAIFAPAKTLPAIINRLNREIVQVLSRTDVKERFLNAGVEVIGSSPEQLAAAMKSDMARMGKVIRDAGIRAE